jgi:hypothetical protein
MTEMQTLASLVSTITDLHDMISTTQHGSQDRQSVINTILSGEKVNHAFDELLTRSYQGFDDSLFYQFALLDLTGTQLPRLARGYLEMERAFPNDSVKAMVLLYKGLHSAGNPAQEVIDNVAEFLRDSKLGGDDVAWKLLSEIATYHSARVGEVPAERGSTDNFAVSEDGQKLSKKRPISALIYWIVSLFFIEALADLFDGDEIRYHLMMRAGNWPTPYAMDNGMNYNFLNNDYLQIIFIGGIIVSAIFSFCLFAVGTNQRKITAIDGENKRSFLSLLFMILIANILIMHFIIQSQANSYQYGQPGLDYYPLAFIIVGITIVIYSLGNSKWANTWNGSSVNAFHWPRFSLTFILIIYWFAMWVLLLNIHDDIVEPFDDFENEKPQTTGSWSYNYYYYDVDIENCFHHPQYPPGNTGSAVFFCKESQNSENLEYTNLDVSNAMVGEAAFFYGVNLMLFSTISLPLLFAGITKKNLKVSALSVLTVFFIFMVMFSTNSNKESFFSLIAMAWLAIPMSYYVWMSPWPEEVTTTEAF